MFCAMRPRRRKSVQEESISATACCSPFHKKAFGGPGFLARSGGRSKTAWISSSINRIGVNLAAIGPQPKLPHQVHFGEPAAGDPVPVTQAAEDAAGGRPPVEAPTPPQAGLLLPLP